VAEKTLVFVISWGRPLYLWACLDALYRNTRTPARVVLIDNWHPDRQVDQVIRGFEKRGLFDEVHRFSTNSVDNIRRACAAALTTAGPEFVILESDTVIEAGPQCWLGEMLRIFRASPEIGMLGSMIDTDDFVPEAVCDELSAGGDQDIRFLAKLQSPERGFRDDPSWGRTDRDFFFTEAPCPIRNPPGRLLLLRTDVIRKIGVAPDGQMAAQFRKRGMRPAVTPKVRHRHLSLLNVFDYEDYSGDDRNGFFEAMRRQRSGASPPSSPGGSER